MAIMAALTWVYWTVFFCLHMPLPCLAVGILETGPGQQALHEPRVLTIAVGILETG